MTAGFPVTSEMAGRTCPYCRFDLEEGVNVIACPVCQAVHHDDCWEENGGCAVALCAGGPSLEATPQEGAQQAEPPPPPAAAPTPPPLPPVVPPGPSEAPTQKFAGQSATPPSPAAPPPPPGPPLAQGRPSRSRWVPLIAVAIVLLGGASAAAIVLTKHGSDSSETVSASTPETPRDSTGFEEEEFEEGGAEEGEFEEGEFEEPESSPSPSQLAQRQIQHALKAHFNRLVSGNYEDAYYDLNSRPGEEFGGESGWVAEAEKDQLQNFSLSVETSLIDPHTAKATIVEFQTHSLATGCKYWNGYWEMRKIYGEWLINTAKLGEERC